VFFAFLTGVRRLRGERCLAFAVCCPHFRDVLTVAYHRTPGAAAGRSSLVSRYRCNCSEFYKYAEVVEDDQHFSLLFALVLQLLRCEWRLEGRVHRWLRVYRVLRSFLGVLCATCHHNSVATVRVSTVADMFFRGSD